MRSPRLTASSSPKLAEIYAVLAFFPTSSKQDYCTYISRGHPGNEKAPAFRGFRGGRYWDRTSSKSEQCSQLNGDGFQVDIRFDGVNDLHRNEMGRIRASGRPVRPTCRPQLCKSIRMLAEHTDFEHDLGHSAKLARSAVRVPGVPIDWRTVHPANLLVMNGSPSRRLTSRVGPSAGHRMGVVRPIAFRELWRIPRTTKSMIINVYMDGSRQIQGSRIAAEDVDAELSSRGYQFVRILNRQSGSTRSPSSSG